MSRPNTSQSGALREGRMQKGEERAPCRIQPATVWHPSPDCMVCALGEWHTEVRGMLTKVDEPFPQRECFLLVWIRKKSRG